ncbi:MAG TPA: ribbon-helix-helix protein, CopG family [Arenibaculum sp.]|nr:ribbon-helix-helix protein, CopG family [Arenibaculum sp.]
MARTNPLGVRVQPEIKAALDQAAQDDDRSISSMVERILKLWLMERGYLSGVQRDHEA